MIVRLYLRTSIASEPLFAHAISSSPSPTAALRLFRLLPISNCPSWPSPSSPSSAAFTGRREAPLGVPALNLLVTALCRSHHHNSQKVPNARGKAPIGT
ncbi:hypothetical protein COCNU_scaffold146741G000010 [Cocos nucifera]|nr:hypothetical protein [Cocos nucifera]